MHQFVKLAASRDEARLHSLLERCSDYYEMHEGCSTPSDAGEYELKADPKQVGNAELVVFALEDPGSGSLDAVLQFVKDLPKKGTWWIGLLVVAPELRSRGLGSALLRDFFGIAANEGVRNVKLSVSLRNPRGLRFWEREGFRDTQETCSITARGGHVETGRIMIRELAMLSAP